MTGKVKPNEGDWICQGKGSSATCGNVNFSHRTKCNKCNTEKQESWVYKKGTTEIGKQQADKSGGLFNADDWMCKSCGNINWARRPKCNICNSSKLAKVESRTGLGGGYKDRDDVVEYKEKVESDDEFDEFGLRKKKFRGHGAAGGADGDEEKSQSANGDHENSASAQEPSHVSKEEDDNDESVDDEEEEDDDENLDKYNLLDEDDVTEYVEKKKPGPKERGGSHSASSGSSSSSDSSSSDSDSSSDDDGSSDSGSSSASSSASSDEGRRSSGSRPRHSRSDNSHRRERGRSRSRSPIDNSDSRKEKHQSRR